MTRVIFHVDMDAFFASVEALDHPELKGKCLIVGGNVHRGVVAAASYEARRFGVKSAMSTRKALALCPQAIVVAPRMERYRQVSQSIMEIFESYSPAVEPLSVDEAFLDMSGTERVLGPALKTAERLKADIREQTRLTASVGVAPNKFLAKLASDLEKPDGLVLIPDGQEASFIADLPIRKIWGVGPKTETILVGLGLKTIANVAAASPSVLRGALGHARAEHIQALARGEDERAVVPDRKRKSIGHEETLAEDLVGFESLRGQVQLHADRVSKLLRDRGLLARGVRVKVRYSEDFQLATRQQTLSVPSSDSNTFRAIGAKLLGELDLLRPIRLVGVTAYDLIEETQGIQIDLFDTTAGVADPVDRAMDEILERFGNKIWRGDD